MQSITDLFLYNLYKYQVDNPNEQIHEDELVHELDLNNQTNGMQNINQFI